MSIDSQIRDRLHSAVDDTTAPPAFARTVMRRGRARRRRRNAAGVLAAAGVIAVGSTFVIPDSPTAREGQVANGGQRFDAAMAWAQRLPKGANAKLPYYGEGGLRDGDTVVPLPEGIATVVAPQRARGGWVVALAPMENALAPAVLASDGSIRTLPAAPFGDGSADATIAVSPDGSQVAYGDRVVDLATLDTTEIPHNPAYEPIADPGHDQSIRLNGFTDQGLVYRGSPTTKGWGTTWLLKGDGTTVEIEPPTDSHIPQGGPADFAISYDYTEKANTCTTSFWLIGAAWQEQGTGCMGSYLSEAVDVSPDRRWLLTDHLPRVWNLSNDGFTEVDIPRDLVSNGEGWMGNAGWESNDSFLLALVDQRMGAYTVSEPVKQQLQIVRCTISTGTCERAGDLQHLMVSGEVWGTSEVTFTGQ